MPDLPIPGQGPWKSKGARNRARGRDYTSVGDTSADSTSEGRTGVVLGTGEGAGVQDVGASDTSAGGETLGGKEPEVTGLILTELGPQLEELGPKMEEILQGLALGPEDASAADAVTGQEMKEPTLMELGTKKEEILQGLAGRGITLSPQDGVVRTLYP